MAFNSRKRSNTLNQMSKQEYYEVMESLGSTSSSSLSNSNLMNGASRYHCIDTVQMKSSFPVASVDTLQNRRIVRVRRKKQKRVLQTVHVLSSIQVQQQEQQQQMQQAQQQQQQQTQRVSYYVTRSSISSAMSMSPSNSPSTVPLPTGTNRKVVRTTKKHPRTPGGDCSNSIPQQKKNDHDFVMTNNNNNNNQHNLQHKNEDCRDYRSSTHGQHHTFQHPPHLQQQLHVSEQTIQQNKRVICFHTISKLLLRIVATPGGNNTRCNDMNPNNLLPAVDSSVSLETKTICSILDEISNLCKPVDTVEDTKHIKSSSVATAFGTSKGTSDYMHLEYCNSFHERGGHIIVLGTMKRFSCNAQVQIRSCGLLSHVGLNSETFCKESIDLGAIDCILAALKYYTTPPNDGSIRTNKNTNVNTINHHDGLLVQYAGSYCLIVLCRYMDLVTWCTSQQGNCQTIDDINHNYSKNLNATVEAMHCIVNAIVSFTKLLLRSDPLIARNGCLAIENLLVQKHQQQQQSFHNSNLTPPSSTIDMVTTTIRTIIVNGGGLTVLSSAIELYPQDAIIQESAKNALKASL